MTEPLVTPDGRYIVVRGRLWRRSDPRLDSERHHALVDELMAARRAVGRALRSDSAALPEARIAVDAAKVALGERGPVWWSDDAPDLTRRMARTTTYADWYAAEAPPK
ncbi:MAG: hypothetical protein ACRYG4_22685 [Janthinobacterium lividum]